MRPLVIGTLSLPLFLLACILACGSEIPTVVPTATPTTMPTPLPTDMSSPTVSVDTREDTDSDQPTAPEFAGISGWINSEPLRMADLRGKVVLIDFWTYTCINCIRTFTHLKEWHAKYADKGLGRRRRTLPGIPLRGCSIKRGAGGLRLRHRVPGGAG